RAGWRPAARQPIARRYRSGSSSKSDSSQATSPVGLRANTAGGLMSFVSLGLSAALANAVEAAGYTQPTPVQQRAIPAVLQGRDLMVAAQTATGTTAGNRKSTRLNSSHVK